MVKSRTSLYGIICFIFEFICPLVGFTTLYLVPFFSKNYSEISFLLLFLIPCTALLTCLYLYCPVGNRFIINDREVIIITEKFRKKITTIPFTLIRHINFDPYCFSTVIYKSYMIGRINKFTNAFAVDKLEFTLTTGKILTFKFLEFSKRTKNDLYSIGPTIKEATLGLTESCELKVEYKLSPLLIMLILHYVTAVLSFAYFFIVYKH